MSVQPPTGLGEPGPIGKKALFKPPDTKRPAETVRENIPKEADQRKQGRATNGPKRTQERVRITTFLTGRALAIIQEVQSQHRLRTGRALPQWRVISDAIEQYGASRREGKQ
jgi:hypothetical protein